MLISTTNPCTCLYNWIHNFAVKFHQAQCCPMEYHTPYPFLVGKLWNIKHASRCSCKLILDHHLQTSSSYITISLLYTHIQLTLQNQWKSHRGSQSSNRECQIKVGSILNILTNINKEHPEKNKQKHKGNHQTVVMIPCHFLQSNVLGVIALFPGHRRNSLATYSSSNSYFLCQEVGSTNQIS